MKIDIKLDGLAQVQDTFREVSDRRLRAIAATTLTRTAKRLSKQWQGEIDRAIDRPVARTQKAVRIEPARADSLTAMVALKDAVGQGMAPGQYLQQHEHGGGRLVKKFEQALINSGAMPSGYITVPGRGAGIDGYGNVSRATIIAVIAQLGRDYSPGYQRVISKSSAKRAASMARHGRRYIVMPVGNKSVSPGVYERRSDRTVSAVFLFKKMVSYSRKLTLQASAQELAPAIAAEEFDRALSESLARLAARGAAR